MERRTGPKARKAPKRVGGITLDTADRTVSAAGPYELMLGQIRTRDFFTPRELLIKEEPDTARAMVYRLHVFFEPGEIRQISEDGMFNASYNVFSGEWSFREAEHETREVRDDFPHQPLSLWMGTPQFLPIWGGPRSLWRTHQFQSLGEAIYRASYSEVSSGLSAGYADIDTVANCVNTMRFHSTTYTLLDSR